MTFLAVLLYSCATLQWNKDGVQCKIWEQEYRWKRRMNEDE